MSDAAIAAAPVLVTGLSNQEFLERHARAGCIGLSGGVTWVDKAICRAERHLDERERWGVWSHAFIFQGRRADGQHWVIESDLQIHHKHIRLGVQENRVTKYHDEESFGNLAVLDFGLTETQLNAVLAEGLEMVATRTRYSVRELFGTLLALRKPEWRADQNLLAQDHSLYCSAFVQHLFRKAGMELIPGIAHKHSTPEEIARTPVPHTTYLLQRETPRSRLRMLGRKLRHRVKARARILRRKSAKG